MCEEFVSINHLGVWQCLRGKRGAYWLSGRTRWGRKHSRNYVYSLMDGMLPSFSSMVMPALPPVYLIVPPSAALLGGKIQVQLARHMLHIAELPSSYHYHPSRQKQQRVRPNN